MKSVAIIGAPNDRAKFGNKAVRAFVQQGCQVYPVNPKEAEIEGLPAFKGIRDVPVRPEMVSVYLSPAVLLKVLPDIAAKGCDELWLNPGTESDEVLAEAERLGLHVLQACSIVSRRGSFAGRPVSGGNPVRLGARRKQSGDCNSNARIIQKRNHVLPLPLGGGGGRGAAVESRFS